MEPGRKLWNLVESHGTFQNKPSGKPWNLIELDGT
jgi:hypothetical protein